MGVFIKTKKGQCPSDCEYKCFEHCTSCCPLTNVSDILGKEFFEDKVIEKIIITKDEGDGDNS